MTDKSIDELFAKGAIDPLVIEELSLIDEASPLGKTFQKTMQSTTDTLYTGAGLQTMPIRFMLSTRPELNACIIPTIDPPVIILNQGVFDFVETLDQLEAIIAHEIGHVQSNQKAGEKLSGRAAETYSDGFSGYVLYHAKRDLREIPKAFEKIAALEAEEPTLNKLKGILFGKHPGNAIRARMAREGIELLGQTVGAIPDVEPRGIGQVFSDFTGLAHTDPAQEMLDAEGFVRLPGYDALHIKALDNTITGRAGADDTFVGTTGVDNTFVGITANDDDIIDNRTGVDPSLVKQNAAALLAILPHLPVWAKEGKEQRISVFNAALESTFDAAMDTSDILSVAENVGALSLLQHAALAGKNGRIYEKITDKIGEPEFLSELRADIASFTDPAANDEALIASAKRITDNIESHYLAHADLSDASVVSFIFPELEEILETEQKVLSEFSNSIEAGEVEEHIVTELLDKHGRTLPWNTQVKMWERTQNSDVLNVLRYLSVYDPRLPKATEADVSRVIPYSTEKHKGKKWTVTKDNNRLARAAHAAIDGKMVFSGPLSQRELAAFISEDEKMGLSSYSLQQDESKKANIRDRVLARAQQYEKLYTYIIKRDSGIAAKQADFSTMETNFWGFVKENVQWLTPMRTVNNASNPFVEKFTTQLNTLIERDPDTFKPLAYTFFTGRDYSTKEMIPIIQGQEVDVMTLPALIERDIHAKSGQFRGFYKPFQSWDIFILGRGDSQISGHRKPHGIDMTHPYITFLQDDTHALFNNDEKTPVLQHGRIYRSDDFEKGDDPARLFEPSILKTYASDDPLLIEEVAKKYGYLEAYLSEHTLERECRMGEHDGSAYSCYRPNPDVEAAPVNLLDIYLFEYEALKSLSEGEANTNPRDMITLISIANHCNSPLSKQLRGAIYETPRAKARGIIALARVTFGHNSSCACP